MVDHGSVVLFAIAAPFAPLKIHRAVGAVAEGEKHFPPKFIGAADPDIGFILRDAGAGLHDQERFAEHRIMHVVQRGEIGRHLFGDSGVPGRVTVVGDEVAFCGEFPIIQQAVKPHHIGGGGQVGEFPDDRKFHLEELDDLRRNETAPIERSDADRPVRGVNLIPVGKIVPPEGAPIVLIEIFERLITVLQEIVEFGETFFAEAFAAVFVADVPAGESGVFGVAFRQLAVDDPDPFPEEFRRKAMFLPFAPGGAVHAGIAFAHKVDFRVIHPQPRGAGGGRRGQKKFFAASFGPFKNIVEPGEVEHALLFLDLPPGEDRHRKGVAMRFIHQFEIAVDNAGVIQPLIGIVVAPMQNMRIIADDCHSVFYLMNWKWHIFINAVCKFYW